MSSSRWAGLTVAGVDEARTTACDVDKVSWLDAGSLFLISFVVKIVWFGIEAKLRIRHLAPYISLAGLVGIPACAYIMWSSLSASPIAPEGHKEPMKYWLSTLPEEVPLQRMVLEAKMRWRIERDYEDLKQELGLGHYEGRGWRGFHHHASLSIAAYGFLMAQQLRHPQGVGKKNAAKREEPALPTHYKPRGSPAHAAPRPIVHHELAAAYRRSIAQDASKMSVLPARKRKAAVVTQ